MPSTTNSMTGTVSTAGTSIVLPALCQEITLVLTAATNSAANPSSRIAIDAEPDNATTNSVVPATGISTIFIKQAGMGSITLTASGTGQTYFAANTTRFGGA